MIKGRRMTKKNSYSQTCPDVPRTIVPIHQNAAWNGARLEGQAVAEVTSICLGGWAGGKLTYGTDSMNLSILFGASLFQIWTYRTSRIIFTLMLPFSTILLLYIQCHKSWGDNSLPVKTEGLPKMPEATISTGWGTLGALGQFQHPIWIFFSSQ